MANPLLLKLVIEGTNAGAIRALKEVQSVAKGLNLPDAKSSGISSLSLGLADIQQKLKTINGMSINLAGVGVGLGLVGVLQMADAYKNMTNRLQVVTKYTGDFDSVMGMLGKSAISTRSSLERTVDLYVKISPALRGIGLSAGESVGVITTINNAINLSGSNAESARAALMQFGQGMASGVLRGEELNSVMEQAPFLAQALADGLGVPIGALRKMGEQGELTSVKVVGALQKMSEQIALDVETMPKTVGQSLQALHDAVMLYVGQTDAATGSTSALSEVILALADAFRNGHPVLTVFTESLRAVANGMDFIYRLVKITAVGLAGYAAAIEAASRGDFSGARDIYHQMSADVSDILAKRLAAEAKVPAVVADSTKKIALLQEQLKVQVEKFEAAKLFIATGTAKNITASAKASVDAQVADQQRLVDAVRGAWQASLAEVEKARSAQKSLLDKADDYRQRGSDAEFNASLRGKSDSAQLAAKSSRLSTVSLAATNAAKQAQVAALEGDVKKFEALAGGAEKRLLAALSLAEDIGSVPAIRSLSKDLAALQDAGAKLEGKKADKAQETAESQATLLNSLQEQLEALQKKAREIEVKADIEQASTNIAGLQNQIDALQNKTITITANVVSNGASPGVPADAYQFQDYIGRARGGPLPGWAPHDRADNVLYRGTPGEWVIQRPAVRYYGSAFMSMINKMQLPGFAHGGQLGGMVSRLQVSSLPSPTRSDGEPAVLDMGALGRVRVRTMASTSRDVESVIHRAALRFGG